MLKVQFILEIPILECSQRRIQTWTYTGRVQSKHRQFPTETKPSVTSCAHVNVSPPVICIFIAFRRCRKWFAGRKDFPSGWVQILSAFSVSRSKRLFLETTSSYWTSWTQRLFRISSRRNINVNKLEVGQSTRGWKIFSVLQFAVVVQARKMFWSISEVNVSTAIRFFQNLFFTKSMTVIITFFYLVMQSRALCSSLLE